MVGDYLMSDEKGKRIICQALLDSQALVFGKIIPAICATPYYIETRNLFSKKSTFDIIVKEMTKLIKQLNVDLIAGCEFAGVPLAAALCLETGLPTVYLRKKPKEYGSKTAVVGQIIGKKAVLIDDASGRGAGKEKFATYLQEKDVKVTDMLVIYWTNHPLIPWYKNNGIRHHQLIMAEDFINYAKDVGYISDDLHALIWDWWKDYNIEKRSLDWKRWDKVFAQAKKEGFVISNEKQSYEEMLAESKRLGKWVEPLDGKYEYI
ncbi:hypothetical protein KKC17_03255 [Patescibacteria group bacterium]|nr:hypothetical protein [Patescibacteria group bacterium]